MRRSDIERWLADEGRNGRGARSRNAFREALLSFCNWCVRDRRLTVNVFDKLPKANTDADPRRRRRALTETDIGRLLDIARRRPVLDALTVRRGDRQGQQVAKLTDTHRKRARSSGAIPGSRLSYPPLDWSEEGRAKTADSRRPASRRRRPSHPTSRQYHEKRRRGLHPSAGRLGRRVAGLDHGAIRVRPSARRRSSL